MIRVQDVCDFLEEFAPSRLAEEWDNVGLLVGRRAQPVEKIMTCLTITPASAAEAVQKQAGLVVTHHPLPFRPLQRLTDDAPAGRMLLDLIRADIAVYSPHTAFDSAAQGINQCLAEGLGLCGIQPLLGREADPQGLGAGRWGTLSEPMRAAELAGRLKQRLGVERLQVVGSLETAVESVGVACGSAGEFLDAADRAGCGVLVTGETSFHTCLDAQAREIVLLLPGHYASERFAVERLAETLAARFDAAAVWSSRRESDPLQWV